MQAVKVVVVGDGAVGKTTFLISLTLGCFPTDYIPTTLDNYNAVYLLEGRHISLGLWDTAGQADFDNLRPISYKGADVVLLFYSVINPTSAENIKEKWLQDANTYCPGVPMFLIGTQIDQRDNPVILQELMERKLKPLSKSDGKRLAKEIGAVSYMECSAKANSNNNNNNYNNNNNNFNNFNEKNESPHPSIDIGFGYRHIFDSVLRYVICVVKQGKTYGKYCWSIDCRQKMGMHKLKCQGKCGHTFCTDCIEVWEDGFKGCPQCVFYEREERNIKKKKISPIKKSRILPSQRAEEQLERERIKEEKERFKAEKIAKKAGEKHPTYETFDKSETEKSESKKENDTEDKSQN